ncbi:hypothetical protein HY768_11260 [candidate division TA06 bacterium]|uniref:HAD family phosphatase n=1 Tax=candidate division TA06 bacterium TaxID=2250710 RepID=A0A933IAU0_UNCT6|nr:hypothetical protein [candidate division TA06 bacterium]
MIDTIIFDADGVILDSEKLWNQGQEKFLKRGGFKYDRDKLKHLMTSDLPGRRSAGDAETLRLQRRPRSSGPGEDWRRTQPRRG